jgi:hypothetical protein
MNQRPILFSTPMVQAILEGRKTQTRRTKGLEFINESYSIWRYRDVNSDGLHLMSSNHGAFNGIKCPYGQRGDVLWVRETFLWVLLDHAHDLLEGSRERNQYVYKASIHSDWMEYAKEKYGYKWKPSIHMPKEACRIFLRITNVRVEQLHIISRQDAIAEGIERIPSVHWWKNYLEKPLPGTSNPFFSFKTLWQSINGEQSWNDNPWVWVIEFERVANPTLI